MNMEGASHWSAEGLLHTYPKGVHPVNPVNSPPPLALWVYSQCYESRVTRAALNPNPNPNPNPRIILLIDAQQRPSGAPRVCCTPTPRA